MNIKTTSSRKQNFVSKPLLPGKIYYLHLGFYCDGTSTSTEYLYINTIKALSEEEFNGEVINCSEDNCFKKEDDCYNVENFDKTIRFAYIPINLTGKTGKYQLKFDIEGTKTDTWAMVTESNETTPSYNNDKICMYEYADYISKSCATNILEGGRNYYLYIKYNSYHPTEEEPSTYVISNIRLVKETTGLIYETNENGQIVAEVPQGNYTVTEIKAPDGYVLDSETKEVTVGSEDAKNKNVLDLTNAKRKEVIIHYYLKGTGEEHQNTPVRLADDVHLYEKDKVEGDDTNKYDTTKYIEFELQGYTLQVNDKNQYIIPSNATGEYKDKIEHVYYYYEKTQEKLIDITATKQWDIPKEEINNYKATLRLVSIENGKETPVVDADGNELKKEIRGDGQVIFKNLKQYENGTKIDYKVQEIKIEKLESINNETQEEKWVEIPLSQFKVTYGIDNE